MKNAHFFTVPEAGALGSPGMDGEIPVVALVGGSASSITMPVASVAGVRKVPQAWRLLFADAAGENHQKTSNKGWASPIKHGDLM